MLFFKDLFLLLYPSTKLFSFANEIYPSEKNFDRTFHDTLLLCVQKTPPPISLV